MKSVKTLLCSVIVALLLTSHGIARTVAQDSLHALASEMRNNGFVHKPEAIQSIYNSRHRVMNFAIYDDPDRALIDFMGSFDDISIILNTYINTGKINIYLREIDSSLIVALYMVSDATPTLHKVSANPALGNPDQATKNEGFGEIGEGVVLMLQGHLLMMSDPVYSEKLMKRALTDMHEYLPNLLTLMTPEQQGQVKQYLVNLESKARNAGLGREYDNVLNAF